MSYLLIQNGNIVSDNTIGRGDILICDDIIVDDNFSGELPANCEIMNAERRYVAPGFIDIHLHGGAGYDFMDCTEEAFYEISRIHLQSGATTIVPTAVSTDMEQIMNLIETYKKAADKCPNVYGLHLEGPYISVNQKGAHKEKYLHAPNEYETARLLEVGRGVIRRITAAPELNHMKQFAETMRENGVSLALGHSDATSNIALEAFQWGFSHVTHLYSATPSVRKINQTVIAGVIEAAYLNDDVTVELIADGKHAAVDALKLAVKIKGTDHVALVTDALRPAGTNVSESWLGEKVPENRVIIEDGVAKLPDRSSFAGSIATAATLLQKGVFHYGLAISDTVKMLTETPAKILGLHNKGKIQKNYVADFVLFDDKLRVCKVIKNGRMVKGG